MTGEMLSEVFVFPYDATSGTIGPNALQVSSTLPDDVETGDGKSTTAALRISSDGMRLYASNRGHDSLSEFSVDPDTGRINLLGHVSTVDDPSRDGCPRDFILLDDNVIIAANQNDDSLVVLAADARRRLHHQRQTKVHSLTPVALLAI